MNSSEEIDPIANILIPTEVGESSREKTNTQNDEQITHLGQQLEILRGELQKGPEKPRRKNFSKPFPHCTIGISSPRTFPIDTSIYNYPHKFYKPKTSSHYQPCTSNHTRQPTKPVDLYPTPTPSYIPSYSHTPIPHKLTKLHQLDRQIISGSSGAVVVWSCNLF